MRKLKDSLSSCSVAREGSRQLCRASTCLSVSSISPSLSSFDTWRCRIFDAIVDRQVHRLVADLLDRARRLHLDLLLGVLDDRRRLGARLLLQLLAQRLGVGPAPRDDGLGLDARLPHHLRRLALQPLELLPACCASSSDLAIVACRRSSASSSGRQANFASSATRTRNVRIVQITARDRAGPAGCP